MAENLKGKVAIVTGSTTGIGRGIAHNLAAKGCSVVLTGLVASDQEIPALLQEFQGQYSSTFHFIPGNLEKTEETEKLCKDVLAIYPSGVDILINNAGVPARGTVEALSLEDWLQALAINLTAPFILTKAFFPLMKTKGWGRIVNLSSQLGLIAESGKVGYCTTKSGILGFTRVVALEGIKFGVTCNAICPGYVDAPMGHSMFAQHAKEQGKTFEQCRDEFAQRKCPSGKLIPISEVTELVAFLCSDAAANISGTAMPIDGANVVSNDK